MKRVTYAANVISPAVQSFDELGEGMQTALDQAWASIRGGSLGIGAAAFSDDGRLLATGRNRLNEIDPGDDVLAGTSLAHAELNVLAKLRFREHDSVRLHTTLQPCVQCLGAIRLSSVSSADVLAPDPLFRGLERMRDLTPFLARRWPDIRHRPTSPWSSFALLYPTFHMLSHPTMSDAWSAVLPTVTEVVRDVEDRALFAEAASAADAAGRVWDGLEACVDEIDALGAVGA